MALTTIRSDLGLAYRPLHHPLRAAHSPSSRRLKPLVPVRCGDMPRHIMGIPAASVADEQSCIGFAWGFIAAMALMAWVDTRRILANLKQSDDPKDE